MLLILVEAGLRPGTAVPLRGNNLERLSKKPMHETPMGTRAATGA
jgi:hypothetical protein